jgi:RNA polymerase sigma-70 factor, ECF subfamily
MNEGSHRFSELLLAARAGSPEALGRVLGPWHRYLLAVAQRELDSDLQAKAGPSDVVQQTFLEAQRDFAHFDGASAGALRAWLHRLLRNNVANVNRYYRAAKRGVGRERPLEGDSSSFAPGPGLAAGTPSPSGQAMAHELAEALARAVQRLPEDYRRVFTLRHVQGLSFEEVGRVLERSPNAVQLLWMRALDRLQRDLGVSP